MSTTMDDYSLIQAIIRKLTHHIAKEVNFEYLKPRIYSIFTRLALERAEGRNRANYDIMINICESACSFDMDKFVKFCDALREDYPHVYDQINSEYRSRKGQNLPNFQKSSSDTTRMTVSSAELYQRPLTTSAVLSQQPTAVLSQQPIAVLSQQPLTMPATAFSVHDTNSAACMDISMAGDVFNYSPSTLRPEIIESNTTSNIHYHSYGAAVPCPSDQERHRDITRMEASSAESSQQPNHDAKSGGTVDVCNLRREIIESNTASLNIDYHSYGPAVQCPSDQVGESNIPETVPAGQTSQVMQSSDHYISSVTLMDVSLHNNVSPPTSPINRRSASRLRAEYAVPVDVSCISNGNLLDSLAQIPQDTAENNQIPQRNSLLERMSSSQSNSSSSNLELTIGSDLGHRVQEAGPLKKYDRKIRENPDSVYAMDSSPRGYCLIINNEEFQHLSSRKGSHQDNINLNKMFSYLGFKVFLYTNQTAREMKDCLMGFANNFTHNQASALVVVILSHGGINDCIFGSDGNIRGLSPVAGTFINKFDLQQAFIVRNCPSMNGKPKLFILQACRGEEEDRCERSQNSSVPADEAQHTNNDNASFNMVEPASSSTVPDSPTQENTQIAETADMLFLHSASLGYKAYRSIYKGSPFVEFLTERVIQDAHKKNFLDIVLDLQKDFSTRMIGSNKMTMPEYSSCLTKTLYFNPPDT